MSKRSGAQPPRHDMRIPFQATSLDMEAQDQLVRSHGVKLTHLAMAYCVEGSISPDDIRPHEDHSTCSGGMKFYEVGEVEGWIHSNSNQADWRDYGIQDGSTMLCTVPRFYDKRVDGQGCECPIVFQVMDRLYIAGNPVTVSNAQKFEHHQSGIDRMVFPVVSVQRLEDSRGKVYRPGVDFDVVGGNIAWRPGKAPGYDAVLGRGITCSIRYQYTPYYSVSRIIHEVRVTKDIDPVTGEEKLVRGPFELELTREWVFQDEDRAEGNKNATVRDVPAPRRGGFGPR